MQRLDTPNWTGPPPPPPRSLRIMVADWFARWGFVLLTLFFLILVAAAAFILPELRATRIGPLPSTPQRQNAETVAPVVDETTAVEAPMFVTVTSVPPGARVSVDIDSIGVTPLHTYAIAPTVHLLTLELDGYARVDTLLYGQPADTSSYRFALRREDQPVRPPATTAPSQTDPEPAERQRPARVEPDPIPDIEEREDEAEAEREVAQPTPPEPARPTAGTLTVNSTPIGARVLVNGSEIGRTPTSLAAVTPGEHNVRLRLEGYDDYETTAGVTAGRSTVIQATMIQALGSISVLVRPWGSIYIDGRLEKRDIDVEHTVQLPAGTHTVVVTHPTLGRVTRTVEILPGQTQRLVFDLNEMDIRDSDS